MAIQKITIEEFLQLAKQHPVFDVRSPGEYNQAHIPGAYNLALFTDDERAVVGTTYKQQSRQKAIKAGLDYFGPKMGEMVEAVEKIIASLPQGDGKPPSEVLGVHCWRGGMRSAALAWLLDLYGYKVYTLVGGYKAYRKWVLAQFEKQYQFNIIGGYTGSGKTLVLQELEKQQLPVIDLEALAKHKGSAFGAFGETPQPTQEMFENLLAQQLSESVNKLQETKSNADYKKNLFNNIYLEDESQRIGNLQIPMPLWFTMRKSPVYFLDIPFEERLNYITEEYGSIEKEKLVNAVIRIQKRLGGLETKNAINYLQENNFKESFRILLTYYDKWYRKGLYNRENLQELLNKIDCLSVDTKTNTQKILSCNTVTP